jgi:hypothetical protein
MAADAVVDLDRRHAGERGVRPDVGVVNEREVESVFEFIGIPGPIERQP